MGSILVSYYEKAAQKGGISAKVKLAMLTKISAEAAVSVPDSPDKIKLFEDAMRQI